MSPIGIVVLKLLRWGVLGIAGFLVLVLVLEAWKHDWVLGALNWGFTAIVVALAVGALWLARSIRRELSRHGS